MKPVKAGEKQVENLINSNSKIRWVGELSSFWKSGSGNLARAEATSFEFRNPEAAQRI